MSFTEQREAFDEEIKESEGHKILLAVTSIINDVGSNFLTMNGGELAEAQSKLVGYKFYLTDDAAELNRQFESLKLELKNIKANEWDRITEEIKAKEGKVKNKEQIENKLTTLTEDIQYRQMLFETLYYKYKLKISSIDSILMAISQRIKSLQKEADQQV